LALLVDPVHLDFSAEEGVSWQEEEEEVELDQILSLVELELRH
jgi:hypothetical protein